MNLNKLSQQLKKIDHSLKNDKSYETLLNNLKDYNPEIKNIYYNSLNPPERNYQMRNDEYKKLILNFSQAYLDLCEWYVGPELKRETFLDSNDSIYSLYFLFIMSMFLKSK